MIAPTSAVFLGSDRALHAGEGDWEVVANPTGVDRS